ncbi:Phenylalanine--tRNA ligase beta subunit [Bienertia sinuspersici]
MQTGWEASWCKFFPTTLKGKDLNWFTELLSGVVTNFSLLEALFSQHFVAARKFKKTSIHLMDCKQGENESLGEYIKRFNVESLEIPNLQDTMAFAALMSGLKPSKFKFDILMLSLLRFQKLWLEPKSILVQQI